MLPKAYGCKINRHKTGEGTCSASALAGQLLSEVGRTHCATAPSRHHSGSPSSMAGAGRSNCGPLPAAAAMLHTSTSSACSAPLTTIIHGATRVGYTPAYGRIRAYTYASPARARALATRARSGVLMLFLQFFFKKTDADTHSWRVLVCWHRRSGATSCCGAHGLALGLHRLSLWIDASCPARPEPPLIRGNGYSTNRHSPILSP